MRKIFIIGATGETGSRLASQLIAGGNEVHALYRKSEQRSQLELTGIVPHQGDLVSLSSEQLSDMMHGCEAVVFTAGASGGGNEMTDAIDGRGVELAATSATKAGIHRFILVSAFPDAWREKRMPEDFEHYMFVKRQADVYLTATKLDWVIVRPGTLLNEPGTGRIRTGLAIPYGAISRDDLASFIVEVINNARVNHVIAELTEGKMAIASAVGEIARFSTH